MPTKCAIGYEEGGKFIYSTSNMDGYPSYTDAILVDSYSSIERARALVSMGDMDVIGLNITPEPKITHNWDYRQQRVCVFYKGDKKEKKHESKTMDMSKFSSLADKYPYVYKFTGDGWEVNYKEKDSIITKPVPEAIDDYFKGIDVNKPEGYYGYMDETEIKVYKSKDIENALYLERKRRRRHQGPEFLLKGGNEHNRTS